MDRQQAGDLLDDDLPGQLDGPAAAVGALPLGLEPTGFLTERQTKAGGGKVGGGGGRRRARGGQRTTGLKVVLVEKGSHCVSERG